MVRKVILSALVLATTATILLIGISFIAPTRERDAAVEGLRHDWASEQWLDACYSESARTPPEVHGWHATMVLQPGKPVHVGLWRGILSVLVRRPEADWPKGNYGIAGFRYAYGVVFGSIAVASGRPPDDTEPESIHMQTSMAIVTVPLWGPCLVFGFYPAVVLVLRYHRHHSRQSWDAASPAATT